MNNKELIQKLEGLKSIKPSQDWKQSNRAILYSQISNNSSKVKFSVMSLVREFFSQPSFALFAVLAIVIFGSIFSFGAVQTKPGDSLYIAKLISERAQLAITFDEVKKNKLNIKFAHERAKEIARVLSGTDYSNEEDLDEKEKLQQDFKKEIDTVRQKINDIKVASESTTEVNSEEDIYVVGANLGRDDNGIQISEGPEDVVISPVTPETPVEATDDEGEETAATSTTEQETEEDENADLEEANKKLEEAEELFSNSDYEGTVSKLEEVDAILNPVAEEGEVQGVKESASSTEEDSL